MKKPKQQAKRSPSKTPSRPVVGKRPSRRAPSARAAKPGARNGERVRFAVVGLGYFAQNAILPAFAHARQSCELVALFSDEEKKRDKLGKKYKAAFALPYEEYDDFLRSGEVQAVYIAVPNHLHREYAVRAARAGVHVLCEKPMAVTAQECREIIEACEENRVKLMIAYRLHLDRANLTAIEEIRKGRIGEPRYLSSIFSFTLLPDNVRGEPTERGGGPLYDIGTYCINAARYLFRAEPNEVLAMTAHRPDRPGLEEVEEQVSAVLRFPEDRLASFTVSFGAFDVGRYTVVGTKGTLTLDPAYSYTDKIQLQIDSDRGSKKQSFPKTDQVAAELAYFADCVRKDREPEPNGWEGYHDVAIINAILESARTGKTAAVHLMAKPQRPTGAQAISKPPVKAPPPLVDAEPPHE
jgi:glucose-fructose oxidoreductase